MLFKNQIFKLILAFSFLINCAYSEDSTQRQNTFSKIQELHNENNYEGMIPILLQAVKEDFSCQKYYQLLGGAYQKINKPELAFEVLYRGYLLNPNTLDARNGLKPAINYIENHVDKLDKDFWVTKFIRAKKAFDLNDLATAEKINVQLLGENESAAFAAILNKDILTISGKPKNSESTFRNVISKLRDEAPEYLYFELGEVLYKSNQFQKASTELLVSINKNPFRRESYFMYGASLLYIKEYKQSKEFFKEAIKRFPDYDVLEFYYGLSHWANNNLNNAKEIINNVYKTTQNSALKIKCDKALNAIINGDFFVTPNDLDLILKDLPQGQDPLQEIFKIIGNPSAEKTVEKDKENSEEKKEDIK